ncbi:MAG: response regulator [Bacteroidales bacterium]|nr:response regulator [Bacteroidales bacterium]
MRQCKILIGSIFILISSTISAQNYYFRQYLVEDGLSNNNVTCCIQDYHGFIWIGTRDGLNRFDGYSFRTFQDTDEAPKSIGNDWITDLALDSKGTLWIATFMGVYKYNEEKENFDVIPFCKDMRADNLVFDSSDNLWLILDGRLVKYNVNLDDYHTYTIPDNGNLRSFCYAYSENIWLVLSNGMLYKFDISSGEFQGIDLFSNSPGYKLKNLTNIYQLTTGDKLFIGSTTHGAKLFDIQTNTYKDIMINEIEHEEININGFVQVSPSEVWIASEIGLYMYDMQKDTCILHNRRQQDQYSLSTNLLTTLFKDKENGIWIGTYSGGINYYTPVQPFQKYYAYPGNNTLKGDIVHDIIVDQYDNLWIATEDEGLNKLDPHKNEYTQYTTQIGEHSISHRNIHGLVADGDKLLVGSITGNVDLIDIPGGQVIKNYQVGDNVNIVIMKKLPGGMILIGTSRGMYIYNKSTDRFEQMPEFPGNIRIQSILEDHTGIVWAGTFNRGLYYYNPVDGTGGLFHHDTIPTNNSNTINDIFEDIDHNLWFATQEGLKKYNRQNNKITRYTVENGMPSNITFRILSDELNNIWVSTTNGLVCLNPETNKIKIYKKEHGLITNQFNYNSSWKDKNGKMYFGMVKGLISFYPEDINNFDKEVRVYLTNMTVFDRTVNTENTVIPISFSDEVKLKNSQSTFSINFSALSFISPSVNKYAFYMEGLDNKWIYLNDIQTAYFTKIPPGDYIFKVKGSNLAGEWYETPATLRITVLPPWWLSKVAMLLYLLIFIGISIIIIKTLRTKNKKKIEQSVKQLEYRKEKELHQSKINFFVNVAHEIRTPLTLITGSVEKMIKNKELPPGTKNYISIVEKNTNRLLKLVDQLLDFRKTELQGYRLSYVKTDIISLLYENCNRFKNAAEQNKLSFNITANKKELYVCVDEDAFVKILSNLLLNSIKYAKSYIHVSFNYDEGKDYFEIEVINDGQQIPKANQDKIFEPFFRGENSEFKAGTGLGLPLARSLAEMHQGTLTLLDTDRDLITFRLQLPINQENPIILKEDALEADKLISKAQQEYNFDNSRPSILIVDDYEEMQNFIGNEINTMYNVLTASNGEEALHIMSDFSVQLLVSDIMMPVMDGFELLKRVKTDLNYSHVPVILLTAKNTQQSRLEGLELGADAYIEKPFSIDILLAQITNLINNRNNIRYYYFNSPLANLKSIAHTKADEMFLGNLNDIIIKNISNASLDVEMLAEEMNMSRPTLYRKIKAVSDLTPNDLIKICRLKKAAELLLQNNLSIRDISESVGFSSQSYFSRSFSKQFGMSPTEYAMSPGQVTKD